MSIAHRSPLLRPAKRIRRALVVIARAARYKRPATVTAAYDPINFFHLNHNVEPAA